MGLDDELHLTDDSVSDLTRQTLREMRTKGEWRDPLIQAAEEEAGLDYAVAKKRVTNQFLDAYRFFRDRDVADEAARVYYSTATVANEYIGDDSINKTRYG